MLTERGILCKVNSVMIPASTTDISSRSTKAVKSRGAFLHNIMPLILRGGAWHGVWPYGSAGPTAQELKALQDSCEAR